MKGSRGIIKIILLAIIILIAIVATVFHLFANRAIEIGIEAAATKTLDVGVDIRDVDLAILRGTLGLQGLVIDNPPGYELERLLELKDAKIAVEMGSFLGETVNIKEIRLDGFDVTLEQKVLSNNLQDILKNINKHTKAEKKPDQEPKKPARKLHIDTLEISNVTVKVKLFPIPGKKDTVTVNLEPIRMTNLGGDNKLDTARLSGHILMAISAGLAEQGVDGLPKEFVDTMKTTLNEASQLGETISTEGKKLRDAGKEALEKGKEAAEGFKELFKKKQETTSSEQ